MVVNDSNFLLNLQTVKLENWVSNQFAKRRKDSVKRLMKLPIGNKSNSRRVKREKQIYNIKHSCLQLKRVAVL